MLFSLLGGLTAMLVMILLRRAADACLSTVSPSAAPPATTWARWRLPSSRWATPRVLGYLPFLLGGIPADGNPHGLRLRSAVPGHGAISNSRRRRYIDNG